MLSSNLPPRELWPQLVYSLPELQYPDTLNVAEQLLAPHIASGLGASTAIIYRGEAISYAALARRVGSLAAGLVRRGIQPGDRVALRMPNRPDFVVAWLALQWIGAVVVSLPPPYRRREIEHIVNHSGATTIICAGDLVDDVIAAGRGFTQRRGADCRAAGRGRRCRRRHAPAAGASDPGTSRCSSPTSRARTGRPGAPCNLPAEILATADTYARHVLRLSPRDVCIGHVPLAWAFGLGALLVFPLRAGAATVLLDGLSPTLLEATVASRATVLFWVPTMYRLLLRQPDFESFDLRSLRCCVSAAEPLPAAVVEEWRARTGLEILDGLGSTEMCHIFISSRPGAVRPGRIGTPVPGYEARIVDERFRDLPDGTPGRLVVRGRRAAGIGGTPTPSARPCATAGR